MARDILDDKISTHCPEKTDPSEWTLSDLAKDVLAYFDIDVHELPFELEALGESDLRERLWQTVEAKYDEGQRFTPDLLRLLERDVLLRYVDLSWKDHLLALDHLKEGIGLRGYGQRDPLNEYKRESYELFSELKERVEDTVVKTLFRLEPVSEERMAEQRERRQTPAPQLVFSAPQMPAGGKPTVNKEVKVGRNDPCPCGSGKKYKKCHGASAAGGA